MRAYSPAHITVPLPEGHRFPMQKYYLLARRLEGSGWTIEAAPAARWADVARVHSASYIHDLQALSLSEKAVRKLGFPQSKGLTARSLASVGGTVAASEDALERGFGVNLAGGTHHAFADKGEGFCVLNDVAVAVSKILVEKRLERILVVDLDVHQGNGSAKLFENEGRVFTFSLHGEKNYPFHKEQSDLDVALPDEMDDNAYLAVLEEHLPELLESYKPQLVYLNGGVDVLAGDRFGRLKLTREGVVARDLYVLEQCLRHGVPLVYVMGGGYQKDIAKTVAAHAASLEALKARFLSAQRVHRQLL